jgi:uncharacterized membrane protein YjgN (DUF898 family)
MPVLIGVPVLVFTLVLQTTAFSRLPLLYGTADIMLLVLLAWMLNENVKHGWEWVVMGGLMVSFVSALPLMIPLWSYSISAGLAFWLKKAHLADTGTGHAGQRILWNCYFSYLVRYCSAILRFGDLSVGEL